MAEDVFEESVRRHFDDLYQERKGSELEGTERRSICVCTGALVRCR